MLPKTPFSRWLTMLALGTVIVVLCIAYVDRPVVDFFEPLMWQTAWVFINRILRVLVALVGLAVFWLLGCGVYRLRDRFLPPWTQLPMQCSWSVVFAVTTELGLKSVFGRMPPYPAYLRDHLYGFRLFDGVRATDAFPSGTATIACALATVLWLALPKRRIAIAGISILACLAVIVANYHWVSDVIAGAFIGSSIGWFTVLLMQPSQQG